VIRGVNITHADNSHRRKGDSCPSWNVLNNLSDNCVVLYNYYCSGDDPLLCPLQQHGTNCHQTSGICSRWDLSNTDSRLICLTVIDMSKHHCISRYIWHSSRPCNGWWGSMLRRVRNRRFIIIFIIISKVFIHVCLSVCVRPHNRTKTAGTTIAKLATGIVHHQSWRPI